MCLAVPAKLLSASGTQAMVDVRGSWLRISTVLVPDAVEGDWVLVHAGFAIQRLDPDEAAHTFRALDELERATRSASGGEP